MRRQRDREIQRRRQRREKLRKLRAKLETANSSTDRERIIQKIHRISPAALSQAND